MDHETLTGVLHEFNDVIRSVAQEKGTYHLDLDEQLSGRPELFLDHVHLTEQGRMEIARKIGPFLENVLSESSHCRSTGIPSAGDGSE